MSLQTRVLVDSVAAASLKALTSSAIRVTLTPSAKIAIIRFGSTCLTSPLSSGAMPSVGDHLFTSAIKCRDHDADTLTEASSALRLCESILFPRVPALFIGTKFRPHESKSRELLSTPPKKHVFDHVTFDEGETKEPKCKRRKKADTFREKYSLVAVDACKIQPKQEQEHRDATNERKGTGNKIPLSCGPAAQVNAHDMVHSSVDVPEDNGNDALPMISDDGPDEGDA